MRRVRVIPVLTVDGNRLVKTVKFKKPNYIGDPINAIKIFNDKEVDEIVVLDITASRKKTPPNFRLIEEMAGECFMPLGYGGGVEDFETAKRIFELGVEKIIVNTALHSNRSLVTKLSEHYGSQSVVVCIDVKKNLFGKQYCYYKSGENHKKEKPAELARTAETLGAGEIILNNIDREGTFTSFDDKLIETVSQAVTIPVVACGGASQITDFFEAVKSGASALAASSMFVYKANNPQSILISYPSQQDLMEQLYTKL